MKSFILKYSLLLCLFAAVNSQAQVSETPAKAISTTDTLTQDLPNVANMPIMTFDKKTVSLGQLKTGDKPEVMYNFTNTGDTDLDILIVSGCDCTELDWTRKTVKPGETGFIKAIFYTEEIENEDHKKQLKKPIDIILKQNHPSNNYPIVETVNFEAFIID